MTRFEDVNHGDEKAIVQRALESWAIIFDNSADAVQLRLNLGDDCIPGRRMQVGRERSRRVPRSGGYGDIPVHIYEPLTPDVAPGGRASVPLIVYLHGGGFVLCDPDSLDACCRRFANGVGAVVISVDYRLAPRHRFPAAVVDAWAATQWAAVHAREFGADPGRLVVAGEGAGANLATTGCLLARDNGGPPIAFQLLIHPIVDQRRKLAASRARTGFEVITIEHLQWFSDQYLGADDDRLNPLATPILADVAGLPPTHLVTAEADPLCADSEHFALRLRSTGVPTTARHYAGMFRGFFNFPDRLPSARRANADTYAIMRDALNDPLQTLT